jgi:hypothetical protein
VLIGGGALALSILWYLAAAALLGQAGIGGITM